MRIKGTMGNRSLHILLDTGSSHNFFSDRFSKVVAGKDTEMHPLQVTVADEGRVYGTRMIKDFTWSM